MLAILINESEGKAWKRTRRVLAKYLPQKGRYAFRTTQASKEFAAPNHGPYGELLYLTCCLAALLHDIGKATQAFQGKLYGAYCYEEYRHDLVGFLMLQSQFAAAGLPSDTVFLEGLAKPDTLWADAGKLFELPTKNPNICHTQLAGWLGQAPVFTLVSWLVLTHHRLPDGLRDIEVQATEKSQRSTHVNTLDINRNIAEKSASQRPAGGALPWQDDKWQRQVASIAKKVSALLEQYPDLAADLTTHAGDWILANVHYNRPLLIAADHLATIQRDKSDNKRHSLTETQFNTLLTATAYANDHRKSNGYWGDTVPQHLRRVEKLTRKLKTLLANVGHFRTAPIPNLSPAISPIPEHSPYHWQQRLAQAAQQNLDNRPVFAAILAETGSGKTLAGVRLLAAISPKNANGEPRLRYTLALGLRSLTSQSGGALRDQAEIAEGDFVTLVGGLVLDSAEIPPETPTGSENAINHDDGGYIEGGLAVKPLDPAVKSLNPDNMPWLDCLDAHLEGDRQEKRDRQTLFNTVHDWLDTRGLQLLETPIVACTVDHLVPATHATSGGEAKMALRIFTSDLVLDEIDNYTAQDLITLGKLCFMVGLAGRHVVLMSATMGPHIVQGLFDAWWRGLGIKAKLDAPGFNALSVHNLPARLIFASNQLGLEAECHDLNTHTPANLSALYSPYVTRVCAKIQANTDSHRRQLDMLNLTPLSAATDKGKHLKTQIYPEILAGCYRLHQDNAQTVNNISISIGFIRFNTAKQAWLYSQWLLEERDSNQDNYTYRIVCYHAKHPRLVLGLMDEKLNRLNNRKDGAWQEDVPELQNALQYTQTEGKQHLMVIVVTTTLQETGRDHDYDWAILEPRSVRGEVQAAGRVRRHRIGAWAKVNILVMSQPMRAFVEGFDGEKYRNFTLNNVSLWGMPGIESETLKVCQPALKGLYSHFDGLGIPYQKGQNKRIDTAEAALPVKLWQTQGFDTRLCLQLPNQAHYSYDDNPIGTLEHFDNFIRLNRPYDTNPQATRQSLSAYLNHCQTLPALALTKKQYRLNEFRASFAKTIAVYCCEQGAAVWDKAFEKFYQRDLDGDPKQLRELNLCTLDNQRIKQRVLFYEMPANVRDHFTDAARSYSPQDALCYELNYFWDGFDERKVSYHWVLGYCLD